MKGLDKGAILVTGASGGIGGTTVRHLVEDCGGFGGEIATPMETDIDVFDRVISINARGSLLVTKYASQSMIRLGKGGAIVNVSSQASLVALKGHISYGSSKAALDNITRVSAMELGPHNIRVNGVHPTVVMTPMSAWYWGREDIEKPFLDTMPLGQTSRGPCGLCPERSSVSWAHIA